MSALSVYTPSITILPGKDKTAYLSLMRKQLSAELAELLITASTVIIGSTFAAVCFGPDVPNVSSTSLNMVCL